MSDWDKRPLVELSYDAKELIERVVRAANQQSWSFGTIIQNFCNRYSATQTNWEQAIASDIHELTNIARSMNTALADIARSLQPIAGLCHMAVMEELQARHAKGAGGASAGEGPLGHAEHAPPAAAAAALIPPGGD